MNLPIKLVDLVTLLFICLLVVIIVFIILQRNIKRFKIRNIKDPHFLACKSIPKELKDAILRKHGVSNTYVEPSVLLDSNYTNLKEDKASSFITRMKCFEASRSLEYALCDCGFTRWQSSKFEDFIENLIQTNDVSLPNDLLRDFHALYIWAMLDPMKFEQEQLRRVNKLINQIIDHLATVKTGIRATLLQHKLNLNNDGDCDFSSSKTTTSRQYAKKMATATQKEVKFSPSVAASSDAQSSASSSATGHSYPEPSIRINSASGGRLTQFAKNVFSRKGSNNINNSTSEKLLNSSSASSDNNIKLNVRTSSSSDENNPNSSQNFADTSFNSNGSRPDDQTKDDATAAANNRWSLNNDSVKGFDSENEEIPLVTNKKTSNHQKKKSGHSIITVIPKPTSSTSKPTPPHPPVTSTTNLDTGGAQNQGFNETNF